jgi:hypothetical protein
MSSHRYAETTQPTWTCSISWIGCQLVLINGCWKIILPSPVNPVEALLREIEKALNVELYYLALLLTLTLPDICVALEQPDGRTIGKRMYKAWYKANVYDIIGGLTPDEAYELRSTVVHQSRAQGSDARTYSRIIFTMKGGVRVDNSVLDDALSLDAEMFCGRWIGMVRKWLEKNKDNPMVLSHLPNLLQVRPNGLAPYIVGMPIIA